MIVRIVLLALCLIIAPLHSAAAAISAYTSTITKVMTYTSYGSGDALFEISGTTPDCDGFWIPATDPGFDATLSMAISMYLAGQEMRIYADTASTWPGSSNKYCEVDALWTN